jgi:hypothetical protein
MCLHTYTIYVCKLFTYDIPNLVCSGCVSCTGMCAQAITVDSRIPAGAPPRIEGSNPPPVSHYQKGGARGEGEGEEEQEEEDEEQAELDFYADAQDRLEQELERLRLLEQQQQQEQQEQHGEL